MTFFGLAIEMASAVIPALDSKIIADYFMHRASVFEALGMIDHSRLDYQKVLDADPSFYQRYHKQVIYYERMGMEDEANEIRQFLLKIVL